MAWCCIGPDYTFYFSYQSLINDSFLHGFLNGSAMAVRTSGGFLALTGIAIAVFVLVALITAMVVSMEKQWARIAVRIAGSWIAAIGLLMLGWTYRMVS